MAGGFASNCMLLHSILNENIENSGLLLSSPEYFTAVSIEKRQESGLPSKLERCVNLLYLPSGAGNLISGQ